MHGCSYKENETDTIFKNKIQTKNEFSQRVQILLSDQKSALVFLGIGTFNFEAMGSIYCVIKKKKTMLKQIVEDIECQTRQWGKIEDFST